MKRFGSVVAAGLALALSQAAAAGGLKLAENGRPLAEIVLATNALKSAQFVAIDLQNHLKHITGGDFAIVTTTNRTAGAGAIYVGWNDTLAGFGLSTNDLQEQEYVIRFVKDGVALVGHDEPEPNEETFKLDIRFLGINTPDYSHRPGIPTAASDHASCYAVYDFLRLYCGVSWLDPTDAGTVFRKDPNLAVKAEDRRDAPFIRYRAGSGLDEPETWRRKDKEGRAAYMDAAYQVYRQIKSNQRWVSWREQKNIFLFRQKLGGLACRANHSFYDWYDRYWQENPKSKVPFEGFHPEYFSVAKGAAAHKPRDAQDITAGYDLSKRPAQLCYSNPEVIRIVTEDVRKYFARPPHRRQWGRNACCLEPMDNSGFCQCDKCAPQFDLARAKESGQHSDYWARFVNAVARELKKTHPDKYVSTLAYATRKGMPKIRYEDNVIVHFCWDGNRQPNWSGLEFQRRQLELWREAYPKNEFGLWLYNCFPSERTDLCDYLCFPGFFAQVLHGEYRTIRDLNFREVVYNCGWKDDFENFLSARWMWNPDEPLEALKDEFFSSYGPAEKPIRAFYDAVEERFSNPSNYWYVKADGTKAYKSGHQDAVCAWGVLGTPEVVAKLGRLMEEAERAPGLEGQAKARVLNWRRNYWDYINEGTHMKRPLTETNARAGVRSEFRLWLGRHPEPFADSKLAGAVTTMPGMPRHSLFQQPKGEDADRLLYLTPTNGAPTRKAMGMFYSPPKGATTVVFRVNRAVDGLKRLRLTVDERDSFRRKQSVQVVGWVGERQVELSGVVTAAPRVPWGDWSPFGIYGTLEFVFEPGTVPEHLDAVGFVDHTPSITGYTPRWRLIEADANK